MPSTLNHGHRANHNGINRGWRLDRRDVVVIPNLEVAATTDAVAGKQEELIDLQLEALRKQSPTPSKGEKADIRVDLQSSGSSPKFVITNWGRVSARNVTFNLDLKEGRTTPLVAVITTKRFQSRNLPLVRAAAFLPH